MDLAEVADELYALPLADFTGVRNERAKQAKADGAKDLAAQIGKLPKPSTSAWAVNTLGRQAPDELDRVLDLGGAFREAQENLDGDELRDLTRQRQALIGELVGRTRAEARAAGHPISDSVAEEVEQTLRAAMADEQAAEAVRSRQLTSAISASGKGQVESAMALSQAAARVRSSASKPRKAAASTAAADDAEATARERERAERELADARTAVAQAEQLATEAAEALEDQQGRVDEASDRREDLRVAVRELEESLRARTADLSSLDEEMAAESKALDAAERAATAARQAADRATDDLEALRAEGKGESSR